MQFHRKLTVQMIAARDEIYAMFAIQPHQIKAARNPTDPISAITERRRPKGWLTRTTSERPGDVG